MTMRNVIAIMEKMEKIQAETKKYGFGFDFQTSGNDVWRIYFICNESQGMKASTVFKVTASEILGERMSKANEDINVFLDSLLQEVQHGQFNKTA